MHCFSNFGRTSCSSSSHKKKSAIQEISSVYQQNGEKSRKVSAQAFLLSAADFTRERHLSIYTSIKQDEIADLHGDGKHIKRSLVHKFCTFNALGLIEFHLKRFQKWTSNLRLSTLFGENIGDFKQWMFRVVMVDPTSGVFDASQHTYDVVQASKVQ